MVILLFEPCPRRNAGAAASAAVDFTKSRREKSWDMEYSFVVLADRSAGEKSGTACSVHASSKNRGQPALSTRRKSGSLGQSRLSPILVCRFSIRQNSRAV